MSDLENTFGEDFAEQVNQRVQEKRAEREKISDETKLAIADKAINEESFKGDGSDPMFEYTSEQGVTHDILLMQLADPRDGSVWGQVNELDSGAVSVPLDFVGEWIWSIFNDRDMAKKMDEGEWYIVVGNLTQWEPEDGPPQDQLSPVRGVMGLEEAKELASGSLEDQGFDESATDVEAETSDPSIMGESDTSEEEDESDDDSDVGGIFGKGEEEEPEDDDEEEIAPEIDATYSDVASVVETIAEEEPEVWEVTRDHDHFETFISAVMDNLGLESSDEDSFSEVADLAMDRVEEGPRKEDQEDEDEDNLFS